MRGELVWKKLAELKERKRFMEDYGEILLKR